MPTKREKELKMPKKKKEKERISVQNSNFLVVKILQEHTFTQ